jgi:colanic acid/amylovoran biosynthesis glycosyltransferase
MTRLLLFTNDYPYASGDAVFVAKEIDELAARFDEVVVFSHARDTSAGRVAMPANVRWGGDLFAHAAEDRWWTALRPRMLGAVASAAWRELRAGRLRGHARLFLMGARVGITQANRTAVREAAAGGDVVAYAFWGMGGGLGLAWLRGVRRRVVRLHRYDLYEDRAPGGYLPFRPYLFARADRVLAISVDGERHLAEAYRDRALDAKVRLSRLGVPGPERLERAPRGAQRVVVSCSAVTEVKRVRAILDAVSAIPGGGDGAPVRWVHFGAGPLMDDLRARAASAPPWLTVELRGQTPNDEVLAFYDEVRVDAFVNLSASEGVPVSIMEAAAHGIPILATAVGGTPEIVGQELGSGRLVEATDSAEEIGAALGALLDAPEGAYDPRRIWAREFDVRVTGPRAAALVAGDPT